MKNLNLIKGLYAITPDVADNNLLLNQVSEVLRGGARLVQYRNKLAAPALQYQQAKALQALCREFGALFIINDDINLARKLGADGIHLGKGDGSLLQARQILGPDVVIGASCYDSLELARLACAEGADYIAFGAVFSSQTKPQACQASLALVSAGQSLGLPVVAIGGINASNAKQVIDAGADAIAVINGLFATSDPFQAAQILSGLFNSMADVP